jgi:hypothetical protein
MSYGLVSQGPGGFMKPFSSNSYIEGGQEFLSSNSLIAKFAFLMLVLIIFITLIRYGVSFISWLFTPSSNPIFIPGMLDAKQATTYTQNPALSGSIPVIRSDNLAEGLEFTWSVWFFIDDFTYKQNEYKHIFHKGNMDINVTTPPIGVNQPNNAPGLYITPNTNNLLVIMNSFEKINEEVIINDIPLNKWVNVIIRVSKQNQLDVYINGTLTKRLLLKGVPKQNYGDVNVTANGGFSGLISELRYFNSAIGTNQIQSIIDNGPNMKTISQSLLNSKPRYLSTRWFFGDNITM